MSKNSLMVFLLALVVLLSACTPQGARNQQEPPPGNTAYTIVDALGREVAFEQAPSRIVLAGKALFMIADAVYLFPDAPERIVAMGQTDQGTGNFISLIDPDYGEKALLEVDSGAEQVAAYQPDAVFLKSFLAQSLGSSIEALGVPVVYVDFETPDQYPRDLNILGAVLQDEDRAEELAALYQTRLSQITDKTQELAEDQKPRTLLLYYSDKDGAVAFNVPPMNWIQTQLVEIAGGTPVWSDASLGQGWTTVTLEQIAAWDADAIFIVSYFKNPSEVAKALKQDENWALLRATQEDHLYAFAADLYSWDQPDPRWILGLQWLAYTLHPDLFSDLDIVTETREFYQDFYGLDRNFFEKNILPTFKGDLP